MPSPQLIHAPSLPGTPEARSAVASALGCIEPGIPALVHGFALVDGAPVALDPWCPGPDLDERARVEVASRDLEARDLARPTRAFRDRFVSAPDGSGLEAWIYGERALLGRVRLLGDPSTLRLEKTAATTIARTARRLLESEGPAARGTVVCDSGGSVLAYEGELEGWTGAPVISRLAAASARLGRRPCTLVTRGVRFTARPLQGAAGGWLVHVEPAERLGLAPDADLTPTQRVVAEYAAVGATVDEIARSLDASRETIRSHLKSVYRRLEVANRVELARALT